jgi:CSLREA domain-containing protein
MSCRLKLVFIALLAVSSASCSRNQSARDSLEPKNTATVGNPRTPTTNQLLYAVCGVINRCHNQVTINECLAGVLETRGFSQPFSLPSSYDTPSSILQGEFSGTLSGDPSASNSCYSSINHLSCSDPLAAAAYDSTQPNPFSGSLNLVSSQSATCASIFIPVTRYACSSQVYLRNSANPPAVPETSISGLQYSISPALPIGLSLNTATGEISGTPLAATPQTTYLVTATSPLGLSSSSAIQIRTADGYHVNDLSDMDDSSLGDGSCRTAIGTCTLRAAINEANNAPLAKVILVPQGNYLVNSALQLRKSIDLMGACTGNSVVDGQNLTGVFEITAGPTSVSRITAQNGRVASPGMGAGFYINNVDPAGLSTVNVTLEDVVVQHNQIIGTQNSGGAGIYAAGWNGPTNLAIKGCKVLNNGGPGVWQGGGLELFGNDTQATISDCVFRGNSAGGKAGAVDFRAKTLAVSNSLFRENTSGYAGAIDVESPSGSTLSLTNVTFASNSAGSVAAVRLANSVVASINVVNCTFVSNRTTTSQHAVFGGNASGSTVTFVNSLFFDNRGNAGLGNCGTGPIYASVGSNLSDAASSDCNLSASSDILSTNALLGSLQNNGGKSETFALLPDSAALNQGAPNQCPAVDQRGFARLIGGQCDIGAYESQ